MVCFFNFIKQGPLKMLVQMLVNLLTPLFVLHNCYGYYKDRKNRHYRYFFIIMSLYLSFDLMFGYVTKFIPFFQYLKLGFIVWLSLPIFNGPTFIYNFYMKKVFSNYEGDIDAQLEKARQVFVDTVVAKLNQVYGKYQEINSKLLTTNHKEEKVGTTAEKIIEQKVTEAANDEFIPDFKEGFNQIRTNENEDVNREIKNTAKFMAESPDATSKNEE